MRVRRSRLISGADSLPGAINGLVELINPAVAKSKERPAIRLITRSAKMWRWESRRSAASSPSLRPESRMVASRWPAVCTTSPPAQSR
jgi:hypothetical protein